MRRTAWHDMEDLFDRFNVFVDVFGNDIFGGRRAAGRATEASDADWAPRADVLEADDRIEIHAEIPGVNQEEITVSVTNNVLTLKGEKRQEDDGESGTFHRTERVYGSFDRSFTLPDNLQTDNIKAIFKDGVLMVSIPKVAEVQPKEININIE